MKKFLTMLLLITPIVLVLALFLVSSKNKDISLLPSPNGKTNVYVFTRPSCENCKKFKEEFYPKLTNQFKDDVNFYDIVLSEPKDEELYDKAAKQCKVNEVPLLVVGKHCIAGYPDNIASKSIPAISENTKDKGILLSYLNKETTENKNTTANAKPKGKSKPTVYVYLSPTCPYCKKFKQEFYPQLKKQYGNKVNFYEPSRNVRPGSEDEKFFKKARAKCNRMAVPLILVGNQCIIGYSATTKKQIITALDKITNEEKTLQVFSWRD